MDVFPKDTLFGWYRTWYRYPQKQDEQHEELA